MNDQSENFNKDRKYEKNWIEILDLKNAITELRSSLERSNTRHEQAYERTCKLEEKFIGNYPVKWAKIKRTEKGWRKPKEIMGHQKTNLCFIRVPRREEREKVRKFISRYNDWKLYKSGEENELPDSGSPTDTK